MAEALPPDVELERLLERLPPREAVDYLNHLADRASREEPARTAAFAQRAYELALRIGYHPGRAEACRLLGIGALFAGQYAEAQSWFGQAYALFSQLEQREKLLSVLVNGALAYHAVGDRTHALEWLQQALEGGVRDFPVLYLKALNNLGIVLAELGHRERALQTFEEVIHEAERQGAVQVLARACNNAALLCASRGEYARALEYQQRSVRLKEAQGDAYGIAISKATLGYLYAQMGQQAEAERAYTESLTLRRRIGDRRGVGFVLTNLGELYCKQRRFEEARRALSEALQIAQELRETALLLEIARWYSVLCQEEGDLHGALYFLWQNVALLERLMDERTQQALLQVQARYELERARREHEELRRHLVEWHYRALQAQMNPHFLFNALTALQNLLMRQHYEAAQRYIALFAALTRRILDNARCGLISLQAELETVELYLRLEHMRWQGAFSYAVEISPEVDPEEVWCPSLLLQPLVENALKHGLAPRGGRGTVSLRVSACPECVLCVITDDGVGRRAAAEETAHGGMGLRLVQERLQLLSQQLGGEFAMRVVDLYAADGTPAGTRVEIQLPLQIDYRRAVELGLLAVDVGKPVFSP